MSKYCCFFCPKEDFTEKSDHDVCPSCGRQYVFPLSEHPISIQHFTILAPLGRGFYGAAYIAERRGELLRKKYVLKISPKSFYTFFSKGSFSDEVQEHNRLAEHAVHVVAIHEAFEETIHFQDGSSIEAYVSVLDFIDGKLLKYYVDGNTQLSAPAVCQIAIDLLSLRQELENSHLNHNDLHLENLIVERLSAEKRRPDAIDGSIRVKAIDLGSVSDESKSSAIRTGDIAFIASHVSTLTAKLIASPHQTDDRDFRLALALQAIVQAMEADPENSRLPNLIDLIEQIRYAYFKSSHPWRPWREVLTLKSFADHYNAQTLESWNVPALLVDPGLKWHIEVTRPGPQVITGMRGCGKTILLRALDIHARAARIANETDQEILSRVRGDHFVGLFLSAQRLLDLRAQSFVRIELRLTRLFVGYALQAVRALIHLGDIAADSVAPGAHTILANTVANYLESAVSIRSAVSLDDLEQRLLKVLVLTIGPRGDDEQWFVRQSAVNIFCNLAEQFKRCSNVFADSTVFFLLDDVSTRYVAIDTIEQLFSSLLFQSPICAFKFTSEWQTIELGLRSPGRIHPIRIDRDLTVFDLGADVLEKITAPGGGGKAFVSEILCQRTLLLASPYSQNDPKQILGDTSLEQIAKEIAAASSTSSDKKKIFRGLSCLANVCVGDIGDVIKIYEEILRHSGDHQEFPLPADVQSSCFMSMSVRRLYDLNRRAHQFKAHALAFAEASHDLLVRSGNSEIGEARLRQYSSIYVRVTSEGEEETKTQIDQLRELIDAGVFVFAGGGPRSKTKDSNPIQQFILGFRKIYGLTAYMGVADRDRFELSGEELRRWLETPAKAKEILLRNQIDKEVDVQRNPKKKTTQSKEKGGKSGDLPRAKSKRTDRQADLFGINVQQKTNTQIIPLSIDSLIQVRELTSIDIESIRPEVILTSFGFEERTLASNKFLASSYKPKSVHAITYASRGFADDIGRIWNENGARLIEQRYVDAALPQNFGEGAVLIDISGLTKPMIFHSVSSQLRLNTRVFICHSAAKFNYPLESDIEQLFAAQTIDEPMSVLESLDQILRGEKGPYKDMRLLREESDPTRSRALIGFVSPKHERLFSLLDRREYDKLDIIAPSGESPRARVAGIAAKLIEQNYCNTRIEFSPTNDLIGNLHLLDKCFLEHYFSGANVEVALTGSKIHAVAAAALSAARKVSQVWYLQPKEFDEKRFSTGVGPLRMFEILRNG